MPRLDLSFGILVIQNNHERNKPTNTGRLIPEMIPAARLLRYAVRDQPFDASPLRDPAVEHVLLFPRAREGAEPPVLDADTLRSPPGSGGPKRVLVVLDGTWGQCSRMSRRIPELADMPGYALPPGPPGRWGGVRQASDPSRICTLEALIRVVHPGRWAGPCRAPAGALRPHHRGHALHEGEAALPRSAGRLEVRLAPAMQHEVGRIRG
jgi:DTW domain-containing protein YfiP